MAQSFTNPFSITTTYNTGDLVTYGGKLYQALVLTTGNTPLNNSIWTLVSSKFNYQDGWSNTTIYLVGDYVVYGNTAYISLANNNIGNTPNTSINYWRVFSNNYNTIVTTQPGDIQYQGNISPQRLTIGNIGQVLTVSNTGLPVWANTFSFAGTFPGNISITGDLSVVGNLTSNTVTANNHLYPNGESVGYVYALDDISSYFDGISKQFDLKYNNTPISPKNPNQLQIEVGNVPIFPDYKSFDYFNLTPEIYTQQKGFTLSDAKIIFATAPLNGMNFYGTYRTADNFSTFYLYQTPFLPLNIMLS